MKSPKEASRLLSCREPVERALLLTVLLCSCSMHAPAQNIEGQVVASQYGEWKVPSIGIGFTFDPASCQLSGGGKNFPAFSNGIPIKVVDENPGLTEVSNATVYAHLDSSSCSVSLGGLTYGHTSFYLTSGTGGLQEALSNASIRVGGPNTIILNAEWYELVAPGNPATVIGSVTGGSGFGLVDVTTAPYTYYSWSGGHFNVVSSGGGSPTGAAGGSLSGTYPNPALSSTLVLPPATTATTQSNGDNSTKLATDAFVHASLPSIPVSSVFGRVGAVAASSGDYSVSQVTGAAPLASPAFTGTPTAPTQTTGDNTTRVATDAFVQASLPSVPVSSVFGRAGAVAASSGDYSVSQVTGAAPLASPALTGTPTAPTQSTGDNSTKIATDAFVLANGTGVTWPTSADIVLSNATNTPGGLAPVNGDCVVGSGGAWTAGACGGGGTTTNALTLNNSGSGASSGTTFNGSTAVTLSYNTLGAAPLASPAFTGTPTAPTQTTGDNTTRVATDAFVQASLPSVPVSSVFGRAGAVAAGSGDYSVSQVTGAAPLASPALTGTPTAPTQSTGDNSTKIATDAFVLANGSGVTWPTSADIVLSNATNTPGGLAPVNGDCVVGSGGAWTAGACGGSGTTTNALTLNNSGSGASSGATFNGSAAVTLSYNTLGAAPLASPALTGTPTAPTQSCASNTDVATGAYVANCAAGGAPSLSSITAATASSTINNGNNLWQLNYHLTGSPSPEYAFAVSESSASTASANPLGLANFSTLGGSTLVPLTAQNSLTGSQTLPAFTILPVWNTTGNVGGAYLLSITSAGNGSGSLAESVLYNASSLRSLDYLGDETIAGTLTANKFVSSNTVNNSEMTFTTGSSGDSTCPAATSGTSYLCTKSSRISASINGAAYAPIVTSSVYTVSTLPSASSFPAGYQAVVSDASSFTPGTCTGGGSDYMIAITNGSAWSCH